MERIAFGIYLFVLIVTPILFGGFTPYAYTIMTLGVLTAGLLTLLASIRRGADRGPWELGLPRTPLDAFFLAVLAFLILQMLPMPEAWVKWISPQSWVVIDKARSALAEPAGTVFSLAPYRFPVRMSLVRFAAYGIFFIGMVRLLDSRRRIDLAVALILVLCCAETLYGIVETYSGHGYVLWIRKGPHFRDVVGTYYNRNHFAGLMEMGLVLAIGYFVALSGRGGRRQTGRPTGGVRRLLSAYLEGEGRINARVLVFFAGVLIGLGLILSASRGGMLAGAGGMLCLGFFFVLQRGHRKQGLVVMALFAVIGLYGLRVGIEYPIQRFVTMERDMELRGRYAENTLGIFEDFPVAGAGMGSFRFVYPRYQPAEDSRLFFRFAHNDWAQLLAEGGIVAFGLTVAGILYVLFRTLKIWKQRSDPYAIGLGLVPAGAITALAIHSYSDFNLHYPGNALMLAALLAIGYSGLNLQRRRGGYRSGVRMRRWPLRGAGTLVLAGALGLLSWSGAWAIRHYNAETYLDSLHHATAPRGRAPRLDEIREAVAWDPQNAEYRFQLARKLVEYRNMETYTGHTDDLERRQAEILAANEAAVRLDPCAAEYPIRLGWEYVNLWGRPDGPQRWWPASDRAMEAGAYLAGDNNPFLYLILGDYWLMRSRTVSKDDSGWSVFWERAVWHYRKNLALEPPGRYRKERIAHIKRNFAVHYTDAAMLREILE